MGEPVEEEGVLLGLCIEVEATEFLWEEEIVPLVSLKGEVLAPLDFPGFGGAFGREEFFGDPWIKLFLCF